TAGRRAAATWRAGSATWTRLGFAIRWRRRPWRRAIAWPPTWTKWRVTSSARVVRGRDARAARGAGAPHPAGSAAAAQGRTGAPPRHQGAPQGGRGGATAPQLRHVPPVRARSG